MDSTPGHGGKTHYPSKLGGGGDPDGVRPAAGMSSVELHQRPGTPGSEKSKQPKSNGNENEIEHIFGYTGNFHHHHRWHPDPDHELAAGISSMEHCPDEHEAVHDTMDSPVNVGDTFANLHIHNAHIGHHPDHLIEDDDDRQSVGSESEATEFEHSPRHHHEDSEFDPSASHQAKGRTIIRGGRLIHLAEDVEENMAPKTAIVFGASGYVGNAVAVALSRAGFKTFGLIRNKDKATRLQIEEITPVIGTFTNRKSWLKWLESVQFDVIINCTDVTDSADNNVRHCLDTVYDLVGNCRGQKKPLFIFTTGNLMYGDGGRVGEHGFRGLTEQSPYNPHDGAKFRVAVVAEIFARSDFFSCVLLPSYIYGHSSSYYAYIFHQAQTSRVLKYEGCPNSCRTGVHVDDVAQAYVLAAHNPELVNHEHFNVSGDTYDTFESLLTTISKEFGGHHKIEYGGEKGETVPSISQWIVSDKIRHALGWKPVKPTFIEGIKEYIAAWEASKVDGFLAVRA